MGKSLLVLGFALVFATGGVASAALPAESVSASLSSDRAGARPVVLTVTLRTELQCGRLMGGGVVITLPRADRVASSVPASAVLVGAKPAGSVTVAGTALTITLPPLHGAICDSIVFGAVKIVVSRAARIGNPRSAGAYLVRVRHGSQTLAAPVRIT